MPIITARAPPRRASGWLVSARLAVSGALLAESERTLAVHARSFRWGAFFLPPDRRGEAAVIYAFCRMADDLVDEAGDVDELLRVRDELEGKRPARPLVDAFARVVDGSSAAIPAALELIEGIRGDAARVRVDDDAALLRYCYRVAGTVGLLMCPVLGVTDRAGFAHAIDLGIAMQLTNICRDVAEDLALDRVYLPASRLVAAGALPGVTSGPAFRAAVLRVVSDLLDLAERYYESGIDGYRYIPARGRLAISAAARIYRAIGRRLRARGGDPFVGRTIVPWPRKLGETLAAIGHACLGARPARPHDASLHEHLAGLGGASPA